MKPTILLCGPDLGAVSGVSTHLNLLLDSTLAQDFELRHFQVGSEGRDEGRARRWVRLATSPFAFAAAVLGSDASLVHLNTSLNRRAYWRDLAYLFMAKLLGVPVLYQVHGGELPRAFSRGSRVRSAWLRWTLGLPELVAVLAQAELKAYTAFVPKQRVVLLPNAIDCRPYLRVPAGRPRRSATLRLAYVGRLAREKGLHETLQALRIARERGVEAHLTIAGDGPEAPALKREAAHLGIANRVHFAGPVFGRAKVDLYAAADVAVLPSYAEGLPYALLEAMAAGTPVLATPVGAIPDVATHGVHGYFVPLRDPIGIANALCAFARQPDACAWMSRACRRRILAAFSIDRRANEIAAHYIALAGAPVPAFAGGSSLRMERRARPRARPTSMA